MFEDYSISFTTINKLIERVGEDLFTLSSEIDKLKLFKIKEKIIFPTFNFTMEIGNNHSKLNFSL